MKKVTVEELLDTTRETAQRGALTKKPQKTNYQDLLVRRF